MANSNRWMVLGIVVSSAAALAVGCSETESEPASEAQAAIHQGDDAKLAEGPTMTTPAIGKEQPGLGGLIVSGGDGSSAQAPTQNGLDDGECVEDPACESGQRCRICKPTTEPDGGCVEACAPVPETEPPLKGCSGSSGSGGGTGSTGGTGGSGGSGGSGGTGGGGTGGEGGDLNGQIN